MATTLHILNGDATLPGFTETGIAGDVMIWREAFAEGPLMADLSAEEFWQQRSEWICEHYGETPSGYTSKLTPEIQKLGDDYANIVLWFEFDLFCQANLLGVLELIGSMPHLAESQIWLICPDSFPGMADFRGLGELNGHQLASLYPERKLLTTDDLATAHLTWKFFATNNAVALLDWLQLHTSWGNLPHLRPALMAQITKLTENVGGLNYIEQKLLDIYHLGARTPQDIYREFWRTEPIFGFGDTQLLTYLKKLQQKRGDLDIVAGRNNPS